MSSRCFTAVFALSLGASLAACQPVPSANSATTAALDNGAADDTVGDNVLAFAQGACGGCHAVEHNALSPLANAPEWPLIVNREGLTQQTLTSWLRDAHNYPEEMDFDLDMPQVEELAAYMLTLRQEGYEPPIQ